MQLRPTFIVNDNDGFQPVRRGHRNKDTRQLLAALAVDKATGKDGREINPSGKRHHKSTNLKSANHFNGLAIEDSSDEEDMTFIDNADSKSDSSSNMGASNDKEDVISNSEVCCHHCISLRVPYSYNNCVLLQLADSLPQVGDHSSTHARQAPPLSGSGKGSKVG